MHKLLRLIAVPLASLVTACAHKPMPTTAPQVQQEARFECFAEVVEVKQEAWQFRHATYSANDTVWQGVMVVSLRMISPAVRAGEVYNLGVVEESEIVIGGRALVRGDAIRFKATEGVLGRWIAPELFSNLEEVAQSAERSEGGSVGLSSSVGPGPTTRSSKASAPSCPGIAPSWPLPP